MIGIAVDNRFSTINVDMGMMTARIWMYVKFKHRSTVDDRAIFWRQDGNDSAPYVFRKGRGNETAPKGKKLVHVPHTPHAPRNAWRSERNDRQADNQHQTPD